MDMYHNSGNALRFITFHFHNQVLSKDLAPVTMQVTCMGLLFLKSLSNFLKYCLPLFTKENRWLVQGHTVMSGRAETEISSDWTLVAAAEGLVGMLGLTRMSMGVRGKGIIPCPDESSVWAQDKYSGSIHGPSRKKISGVGRSGGKDRELFKSPIW